MHSSCSPVPIPSPTKNKENNNNPNPNNVKNPIGLEPIQLEKTKNEKPMISIACWNGGGERGMKWMSSPLDLVFSCSLARLLHQSNPTPFLLLPDIHVECARLNTITTSSSSSPHLSPHSLSTSRPAGRSARVAPSHLPSPRTQRTVVNGKSTRIKYVRCPRERSCIEKKEG
jgi:hypothetical protein